MISHKYKFIFVHAGRTGGSSFERMAEIGVTADKRSRHMGNTDFPEKHEDFQYYRDTYHEEFASYFKFTIVRNPFDRVVSAWLWRTQVVKDIRPCTLKQFVLTRPRSSTYAAKYSLAGYSLRESVRQFDYIGRFEDLSGTYQYLCKKLGVPCAAIPHTNQTSFERHWDYYDQDTLELVQNLYREDIELFDYRFGPPIPA
jgi:hypothetical protein